MKIKLRSIIIATSQLKKVILFYELMGLVFQKKIISLGTELHWALADDLEIAFIEKPNLAPAENPQYIFSFRVVGVDILYAKLTAMGHLGVLDPTLFSEGRKAILLDPDGRSVELIGS